MQGQDQVAYHRRRVRQGAPLDRGDPDRSRRVLEELIPDAVARRAVVALFVHAIRTAHDATPASWSLTQFARGLRLNVGRLLVAEVLPDLLWLTVLDDAPGNAVLDPWRRDDDAFAVLPVPHHTVVLKPAEIARLADVLPEIFAPTVRAASATASRNGYRNSWSPGAVAMLEQEAGCDLPRPPWIDEQPSVRWWLAPAAEGSTEAIDVDSGEPKPGDGVILWRAGPDGPATIGRSRVVRLRDRRAHLGALRHHDGAIASPTAGWRQLTPAEIKQLALGADESSERVPFLPGVVQKIVAAAQTPQLSAEAIDAARQAFRDRFGPDRLAGLSGRVLLEEMHGRASRDSLVYWLEFKDDQVFPSRQFGSIRGGSALKFGIFQRAEDQQWVIGAARTMQVLGEDEAVAFAERQRDELLAAYAVIDALPDDPADDAWDGLGKRIAAAAPTVHQLAFAHKILSLWDPEKLDDYHSTVFQGHILASLGVAAPGGSLYDAAPLFVSLLQTVRRYIPTLDVSQLGTAMNGLFGAPRGHWRVGSSAGDVDMWPMMRDGNLVAIGWDLLGDLDDVVGGLEGGEAIDALKARLQETYPGEIPQVRGRSAQQLWSFYSRMQEGDLVYVARGMQILGVGRITGSYRFDANADHFAHRRDVRWLTTSPFTSPSRAGLQTTVHNLAPSTDIQAAAVRHIEAHPTEPRLKVERVSSAPRVVGPIAEQLARKGQVILYGPPGTGKTHHALQAAQDIVAHDVHGRPWSALSVAEKRALEADGPGQRIWTCTFHPAFSYEDFVEGLRPDVSAGALTFNPRPGLFRRICTVAAQRPDQHFVLIVDEFNRGDAPRIFGELLTLLELDKRDKVTVVLPTSGDALSVPRNVYLIATMNTADRSIALLDAALRRRFGFLEFLPDPKVLGDAEAAGFRLANVLVVLNRRLMDTLGDAGRNLQIGHAYLMGPKNVHTLRSAFEYDILPLLQEYCGDAPELLERLLGSAMYDRATRRFRPELFAKGGEDAFLEALQALDPELLQREEREPVDESVDA